jgi:multidrug efflux pump subunit AcrA (membrane-fusion protein)
MNLIERKQVRGGLGIAVLAVSAVLVAVALDGCAAADGGAARAEEVDDGGMDTTGVRVINVGVTPVGRSDFVDFIRIVGEVEAMHDITVSAEEAGPIARFFVAKGARVSRRQVIAKIDDAVLRGQVDEARATAELADEQYERQRRLWEEERIGSEIAYLQARSTAKAADARYRTLLARLERTEVRAPVAGVFDEKYVEIGEMVSPGSPIVRVVAIQQVKVVGGVPERFGLDVREGDTARVTFDVLPGREFAGTIQFVGAAVDPDLPRQSGRTRQAQHGGARPGGARPVRGRGRRAAGAAAAHRRRLSGVSRRRS